MWSHKGSEELNSPMNTLTDDQRAHDTDIRMDELWERLTKAAKEISDILKIKESLKNK